MSLKQFLYDVAIKAQNPEYCHKKLLKSIEKRFSIQENLEEFTKIYNDILCGLCLKDFCDKNSFVKRGLEFLAKLTVDITLKSVSPVQAQNYDGTISQIYDISSEQFFTDVLTFILKHTPSIKQEVRLNICFFVRILLEHIGSNVELDNNLCNNLLESLVDFLNDMKISIRLQAIGALAKLQETNNPDCLVLRSFLPLFIDKNAEVRKAVIKNIAPHTIGLTKCRERLLDVDINVRLAAYRKLADIPPTNMRIVDRTFILTRAFDDEDTKVKQLLVQNLLPKWLNCFKNNYLSFLKGLLLDADENDIKKYELLCSQVVETFLENTPITEISNNLKINEEDKVIPVKELNLESVILWSILIKYLRSKEDREHHLINILPDLTPFSNYIEKFIKEKSSVAMEEWDLLKYQSIIFNLFQIASEFDMSDEVGKKKLYSLILNTLPAHKFQQRVIDKLVSIAAEMNQNIDSFTMDICQVISEIREPWIDEEPTEQEKKKNNLELAQLKLKLYELEIAEENASVEKNYQLAESLHREYVEYHSKIENFKNAHSNKEKVRVIKDDPETLCRALDVLIGLMRANFIRITDALRTCKDEFLMPILKNDFVEVHWRVILCLGLYAYKDKEIADEYVKVICLSIIAYKINANYSKTALKWSIFCITDLIRKYGSQILGIEEDIGSVSSQNDANQTGRRKLYSNDIESVQAVNIEGFSADVFMSIISDMLDDEDEDIRDYSVTSLSLLLVHGDCIATTDLMMKLILKWYNPSIWKKDVMIQQKIGVLIRKYTEKVKNSKEIIGKTIIPLIIHLNDLPPNSPLIEIDVDNVMRFTCALVNCSSGNETESIHNRLARETIEYISKSDDACVLHLTKLLTYLDVQIRDPVARREFIASAEMLLEDMFDKNMKRNILKFVNKLKSEMTTIEEDSEVTANSQNGISQITTNENTKNEEQSVVNGTTCESFQKNRNNGSHIDEMLNGNEKKRQRVNNKTTGNKTNSALNSKKKTIINEENLNDDEDNSDSDNTNENFKIRKIQTKENSEENKKSDEKELNSSKTPQNSLKTTKTNISKPYVLVNRIPLKSKSIKDVNKTPLLKRQANTPLSTQTNRTSKRYNSCVNSEPKVKSPMVIISKIPLRNYKSSSVNKKQNEAKTLKKSSNNGKFENSEDKNSNKSSTYNINSNVLRTRSKNKLNTESSEINKKTEPLKRRNKNEEKDNVSPNKNRKIVVEHIESKNNRSKNKLTRSTEKQSKLNDTSTRSLSESIIRTRSSSKGRNLLTHKNSSRLSRKKLDFSESDTTILRTFLQGDEEYDRPESLVIDDSSTASNTSKDSLKENLASIDMSTSSSSSSNKQHMKRTKDSPIRSRSPPKRKILRNQKS